MIDQGVYFLANDSVLELAIAFLNSFRNSNPMIPLCLIPFDSECEKLISLSDQYEFNIFSDTVILKTCDDISAMLHGKVRGQYRKLAAWSGMFKHFIYIDIDTIVLQSISFVFNLLEKWNIITGHSNIIGSRRFVWNEEFLPVDHLSRAQIDYAANTGFVASNVNALSAHSFRERAASSLKLKSSFNLDCAEQPFLNFLFVTSENRYTSLYSLSQFDSAIPVECWAGDDNWSVSLDGSAKYAEEPKSVLFVHWAGEWMDISSKEIKVRSNMKMRHLWLHFRNLMRR